MSTVFQSRHARCLRLGGLFVLCTTLAGCATYESHYSRFEAVNSAGEPRSFVLSWNTKRYRGWAPGEDQATAVRLQTQCSEREWVLQDESMDACEAGDGAAAIRACGVPGKDLDRQGRLITQKGHQCLSLTDQDASHSILELGQDLELRVACYPESTARQAGDEPINMDYLKASVVPYRLRVRTAPLYSMNERPPELSDKVCKEE